MSIEAKLAHWLSQPGASVTKQERQFIEDMRRAAASGVGYGWMQQVIEWEWQTKGPGAHGPEFYHQQISELEAKLANT